MSKEIDVTNLCNASPPHLPGQSRRRRVVVARALVGVVALTLSVTIAPAAFAHETKKSKTAVVVQVVNRAPYGDMLATVSGASLYTSPLPCTGGCLDIWPPLLIPKGKKIPTGVAGLATAKLKGRRRQITYNGKRLYTFYLDSGGDVTGNNFEDFFVATTL